MTTTEPAVRLFQTLYHVARTVNSSLDIMQVLQTIVTSTAEALNARACSLRLLGPNGKHLMFGAAYGLSPAYRAKGPVLLAQSEVDAQALQSGKTLVIEDARCDPRFQYPDEAREEGIVSVLVTPLRVQDQSHRRATRVYRRSEHFCQRRACSGRSDCQPQRPGY